MADYSWIALKGVSKSDVLARMAMAEDRPAAPDGVPRLAIGELANGWVVLLARDVMFAVPEQLHELSVDAAAVGCVVEENARRSQARGFKDGLEIWLLDGMSDGGMVESGKPLPSLRGILAARLVAYREAKAAGDLNGGAGSPFYVPLEVAKSVCGFRFDETDGRMEFTELRSTKPPRISLGEWARRLFRRA